MNEIISAPDVGDGNPATAIAIDRLAKYSGVEIEGFYELSLTSRLVRQIFHQSMTASPEQAQDYTDNSESRRAGLRASVYAMASFVEFAHDLHRDSVATPLRWNAVQEHALLGARPAALRKLGIEAVRLFTPDVFPKDSGISAVEKHDGATVLVWNTAAFEELSNRGVDAELTEPYLLNAFRPVAEGFYAEGTAIVAKSSGSGIPEHWKELLMRSLGASEQDWILHTPDIVASSEVVRPSLASKNMCLQSFYDDLGGKTKALIGYPSELVGVACEMRERDVPVWMLTLPPRGAHEKRNLRFAMDHGLIRGELDMPGASPKSSFSDLERIDLSRLATVLSSLDMPDHWRPGVLGTSPVWQKA